MTRQTPDPAPASSDFISTREAAQMLGVSVRTVQLWVEGGSLVAWKTMGGHRRITRESVEQLCAQQRQAIAMSGTARRFQLLVVEDDHRQRNLYELAHKSWRLPIDLHVARDGFEGLLKAGTVKPDLIIVDLQLPGMNGFRMIEAIRQDPTLRTRILVVTGMSAAQIEEQGGLASDVEVWQKPVPMARVKGYARDLIAPAA